VRNKDKLLEQLIAQMPEGERIGVDSARISWFHNIRPSGGLRLTGIGFKALKEDIKLDHYSYKIKDPMAFTQRTVLALDRKLTMPYYIVTKKGFPTDILFFGSKEAVLVNLYSDLDKFLDNYN
jgi:hypothetical protein